MTERAVRYRHCIPVVIDAAAISFACIAMLNDQVFKGDGRTVVHAEDPYRVLPADGDVTAAVDGQRALVHDARQLAVQVDGAAHAEGDRVIAVAASANAAVIIAVVIGSND